MGAIVALGFAGILLVNAGCGGFMEAVLPTESRLVHEGDYWSLKQLMEQRISRLDSADFTDLYHLCESYSKLKVYDKLFPCLDQMERDIKNGTKFYNISSQFKEPTVLQHDISPYPSQTRAQAYIELGNLKGAIAEASKAYELEKQRTKERNHGAWASARLILGTDVRVPGLLVLAYSLLGDRDRAMTFLEPMERKDPWKDTQSVKPIELAKAYMTLGLYEKAYAVTQDKDLSFWVTVQGENLSRDFLLPFRFMRYKSGYELGHVQEAKIGYDELLEQPQTKTSGAIYWLILVNRAQISEREKDSHQAIDFYKRAVEVIEQQRSTISTEASKIGFVGDKQQVYQKLVAVLLSQGQNAEAFEYVERSKSRALVDLLASKQDFSTPPAQEQRVAQLLSELKTAEEQALMQNASVKSEGKMRSARGVQVAGQLKSEAPELAALVSVTYARTAEIQALLQPDETLVEYYGEGSNLVAFVLTRTQVQAIKLDGVTLTADVQQFRTALEDSRSSQYAESSKKLYSRLIKPLVPSLTTSKLLIVPHGVLHYLPLTALCEGTTCLLDRYSLRLLPSASVMPFLKSRKRDQGESLLAFGNPDLGNPQYDLKFAQEEAVAIAKTFPGAKVLVRKEASKTALRTMGGQFTYLHFATHGKFEPDAPMQSGLLLAGSTPGIDVLTLGDLYSLRLNADLVTLSACETGLGKLHNGDDVVGLTRGFLYAGSSSIVASLWQVDDRATSLLMTEFYANLKKGDKREALRQAQLSVKKQYPHPFYWAAFQLTGMP